MAQAAIMFGSAVLGGIGGANASRKQAYQAEENLAFQRQLYDDTRRNLDPYRKAGLGGLSDLSYLSSGEGRNQFLKEYFQGDEYHTLANQSSRDTLAGASASGGLNSSITGNQLGRIAPTLGLNALSAQQQRAAQLAGIGQNAAVSQGGFSGQYGALTSGIRNGLGQIQGYGAAAPYRAGANFLGGLAASGQFDNLFNDDDSNDGYRGLGNGYNYAPLVQPRGNGSYNI